MQSASILIGMPLFEGWDLVGETLDSIMQQEHRNYRLLISVDGNDRRSFEACRRHASDPRVEIVMQPRLLGWEKNITWLAEHLQEDFFCYWQHDDLCDPAYLRVLSEHATRHPEASAVYCDMQHFGERKELLQVPSVTGFALQRVLAQIEGNSPAAIRCLIRANAMRASLPIVQTGIWAVTLAREGELHRIPRPLYRRRVHNGALSQKYRLIPPEAKRAATLEWGLGVLDAALPVVGIGEKGRLLAFVADQLVNHRPRRRFHYDLDAAGPGARLALVADFLREAHVRYGVVPFPHLLRDSDPATRLAERKLACAESGVESLMVGAVLADLAYYRSKRAVVS